MTYRFSVEVYDATASDGNDDQADEVEEGWEQVLVTDDEAEAIWRFVREARSGHARLTDW